MFSTVLLRGLREVGRSANHSELDVWRVLIQAGLPSTTPLVSALESLNIDTSCHVAKDGRDMFAH